MIHTIHELLPTTRGNITGLARKLGCDRSTIIKYMPDVKGEFHAVVNGKLMVRTRMTTTKDEQLLRDLEQDYERAQAAIAYLEEQIHEVKNRLQGTEKRVVQR